MQHDTAATPIHFGTPVELRAEKQVVGVNARRVVAAMQDMERTAEIETKEERGGDSVD